jgi:5-methylcytosine-specific restriction endonuclease McrA
MRFNDYETLRDPSHRGSTEEYLRSRLRTPADDTKEAQCGTLVAAMELSWVTHQRPYYNVYPIAVDLCLKTSLNMQWGDLLFPVRTLALRFAVGHEPLKMSAVLARVPCADNWHTPAQYDKSRQYIAEHGQAFELAARINGVGQPGSLWAYVAKHKLAEEVVSDSLVATAQNIWDSGADESLTNQSNFLIRLLAFIGLLARGTDLVTPAILASDRQEYDATSDEARKRWLEERARKRLGYSFDVGRKLELERAITPHWRAPHLALFHTGPGRKTPVLKVRSGCVVIPRDMSSVPTGFLGQETKAERQSQQQRKAVFRTAIPKRLRFKVLRRDEYRCQLCGMTAGDGITLQVDHKLAVANGGRTELANLWTLCQPCNSGKSDMQLRQEEEQLDARATVGAG